MGVALSHLAALSLSVSVARWSRPIPSEDRIGKALLTVIILTIVNGAEVLEKGFKCLR